MRYLESKEKFLEFSFLALNSQFETKDELVRFFNAIETDEDKSLFLRTASFYLFLVRAGDWSIKVPGYDRNIEYLTTTLKYISIFALIESLVTPEQIDFFQFLASRKMRHIYPIEDIKQLEEQYREYKAEYGSVRACMAFFSKLSPARQKDLNSKLKAEGVDPSIEELAKYLYTLRSEYVHSGELVHSVSQGSSLTFGRKGAVVCSLDMPDAMAFFEEGLVAHFYQA